MDLINLILVIAIMANTVAALAVSRRFLKGDLSDKLFVALGASIVVWTLVMVIFRQMGDSALLPIVLRLLYATSFFIPILLWHFICSFTQSSVLKNKSLVIGIYAYTTIFSLISLFTDLIVYNPVVPAVGEKMFSSGVLYKLCSMHFTVFSVWAFLQLYISYMESVNVQFKQTSRLLLVGAFVTVSVGSMGNLLLPWLGIFKFDWTANACTIFYAVVVMYAIVKHNMFNIKIVATEFLVAFLVSFLMIDLLFSQEMSAMYVKPIFLSLIIIVSILLIRGVYREIAQREEIEKQEKALELANAGQVNLIHILNHQIKGFLTVGKLAISEVLNGFYGGVQEPAKKILEDGLESITEGVNFTTYILNASSVANGTMHYVMSAFDFKKVVEDVVAAEKENADKKKLALSVEIPEGQYNITGDPTQLREVVKNLTHNAIVYTPSGEVRVSLVRKDDKFILSVKDTGIGIAPEDKTKLFTEGGRGKDSLLVNTESTGYGLSFVKGVVLAHHGTARAESEGSGKGSTFVVELPAGQPAQPIQTK